MHHNEKDIGIREAQEQPPQKIDAEELLHRSQKG